MLTRSLQEVCVHLLGLVNTSNVSDLENKSVSKQVKAQIETVCTIMEILKSLFYCGQGSVHAGFSLSELEDSRYREFRDTVRLVSKVKVEG